MTIFKIHVEETDQTFSIPAEIGISDDLIKQALAGVVPHIDTAELTRRERDGVTTIEVIKPHASQGEQPGSLPDVSDRQAVLKAMLEAIGTSIETFEWVTSSTDLTPAELLSVGSPAERKGINRLLARKLEHELACFCGTARWYRHGGFGPHEILLTEGVMHLAEHGGRNNGTAFWLIEAIASYQGEKVLAPHPFQVWRLIVTETEGRSRAARLVCTNGNNDKPIVEQQLEYTDFLLAEIQLYASVEPVDGTGQKKRVIILLPGEY